MLSNVFVNKSSNFVKSCDYGSKMMFFLLLFSICISDSISSTSRAQRYWDKWRPITAELSFEIFLQTGDLDSAVPADPWLGYSHPRHHHHPHKDHHQGHLSMPWNLYLYWLLIKSPPPQAASMWSQIPWRSQMSAKGNRNIFSREIVENIWRSQKKALLSLLNCDHRRY